MQSPPFSTAKLDALLDESGIDLLLVTSKHNVQYLLGGYRYYFFEHFDTIGLGRYLPVLGYPKGNLDQAFYVGSGDEGWGIEVFPFWPQRISTEAWTSTEAARIAAQYVKSLGLKAPKVGLELEFWTANAWETLRADLPGVTFVDSTEVLEELRAAKSPEELDQLRKAAAAIVDSMVATFHWLREGMTEKDIVEHLRVEETSRGLDYGFTLIATGPTFSRGASNRSIAAGEIISIDTGGQWRGYLADMARMGVLGEPTALMKEMLDEVSSVQAAARTPIKAGALGVTIYDSALQALAACPHRGDMHFVAHGMGLIPHEAPRLTASGPIPYSDKHAKRSLETGMVLSIETHVKHPEVGFVKLEDTVAVTDSGWEAFGDWGRGWNQPELK
ncbi:MAG: aminopeptidase P family protein [Verrucomicrobia bacterium]|nr:aminopeptidase P family protein [Verrucomicrobiota bacterium]MBV8274728.1 aminopeptidase P family protein [Verrucomicrobiota bacterium]